MNSIRQELARRVRLAMDAIGAEGDPQVGPSSDERFGDYQCSCAMRLAKQLGGKPREVAQRLVDALEIDDLAEPPEIAGPGFVNLEIKVAYVEQCLAQIPAAGEPEAERLNNVTLSIVRSLSATAILMKSGLLTALAVSLPLLTIVYIGTIFIFRIFTKEEIFLFKKVFSIKETA